MTDDNNPVIFENERQNHSLEPPITISDVITKLNSTIRAQIDITTNLSDQKTNTSKGFELHTRLPDGSARPATDAEIATADFQSKLQHSMAIIQSMPDDDAKYQWAEDQRVHVGNIYYQNQEYESAMDVYFTCLAVASPPPTTTNDPTNYTTKYLILYMKIMNNLALCTMQLQWYRKAITFCTIAIDQITAVLPKLLLIESTANNTGDESAVVFEQRIKLHFKRAKAYRLKGEYNMARLDIHHAQSEFLISSENMPMENVKDIDVLHNAILKEEQLLQRAIHLGNNNLKHQKNAMVQLLKNKNNIAVPSNIDVTNDITTSQSCGDNHDIIIQPLYHDYLHDSNITRRQNRTFSTLRAIQNFKTDEHHNSTSSLNRATQKNKRKNFFTLVYQGLLLFFVWFRHFIQSVLSAIFPIRSSRNRTTNTKTVQVGR